LITKFITEKSTRRIDMRDTKKILYPVLFLMICFLLGACELFPDDDDDNSSSGGNDPAITVTVSPSTASMAKGTTRQFSAQVTGTYYQNVTWSLEGDYAAGTTISGAGLLTVANNETARTITVKARYSNTASGTATVTVATEAEIPSKLMVTSPGKTGVELSWNTVNGASTYKVYRSNNGTDYSHLADSNSGSYRDTAIAEGSSYYYAVSAVVNGLETGRSGVSFSFAEDYFALPAFAGRRLVPLVVGQKHYYRFPVSSGESYTITWEDGSSQNSDYYIRCSAWQNDGTQIFNNANNGYTSPKVFTATMSGYVTVEVRNTHSVRLNYMAYCLRTNGENDTGIVPLPPASVSGLKVTPAPTQTAISLSWDSVPGAARYNIYRSPTQTGDPGLLGSSDSTSFTDTLVAQGASYYYTIAAENADGREGVWVQGAFGYAEPHYEISAYSGSYQLNLSPGGKHYYRLAVTQGQGYTITWQDGNNQNSDYYIRCSAWQNDGTQIFNNANNGYTSPKVFTATMSGYVTVEVRNTHSVSLDYQIYR
jgi:fibronectin type 3 domain-containing protein